MVFHMKKLTVALLALLLSSATASPTSSPTAAPTAAPTSASTSAVVDNDDGSSDDSGDINGESDGDSSGDDDVLVVVNNTTNNTSNNTTTTTIVTTTTKTTTIKPSLAPVTAFLATLTVPKASDFNEQAYLESIADVSGVPNANVVVTSVDFIVKVSYEFQEDVTLDDVRDGAAGMAGVPVASVAVSLSARRLAADAGRRLAVTVDVEVSTTNATLSDIVKAEAADPEKITEGIQAATGKIFDAPTVSKMPATEVAVVTEIRSTTAGKVPMPGTAAVASKLKAKTGKTFGVVVSADIPASTTGANTTSDGEDDYDYAAESDATKQASMTSFLSVFVAFIVFFGN